MHTILIPLDFSDVSMNAARYAVQFFRNQPTEFICLNVLDYRKPAGGLSSMQSKMEEGIRRDLDKAYQKIVSESNFPGHSFNKVLIHDQSVDGITLYAEKVAAKAIFMGTTGASGLKEVLMGSVASGVIRRAKCPVVTIPELATYDKIETIGLATDFKPVKDFESYRFLMNTLDHCKADLVVVNVDGKKKPVDMEQTMAGMSLEKFLESVPHRYEFLQSDDLVNALLDFMEKENVDMIAMLHHTYKLLDMLFKRSSVEKVAMQTKIPLISLPEL
ncbi:MAG: universal stress protein [Flavobacteriales bacterium]|nr:universal stress protein [Flavobacteriales bacterium]